ETFAPDTAGRKLRSRVRDYPGAEAGDPRARPTIRRGIPLWSGVALATLALLETAAIAVLLLRPAGSAPVTREPARASAPVTSPTHAVKADPTPVALIAPAPVVLAAPEAPSHTNASAAAAIERAAKNQRSGGVRLSSPIELKVVQGDHVLGSTADGPVVMPEGTYQLDLINAALGFRTRQTVTFRTGQISTVNVPIPHGRMSVNAQPWAEVSIDDKPVGETPLAHLDVAVGEHEVVFRHPQFGERRQNVIVRADGPTRVSVAFDR